MNALHADVQAILDFWFGSDESARAIWFAKDPHFDAEIAQRFGPQVEAALRGELRDWQDAPASALACIVLLDQFTRNIYRDTPRAFAGDSLALAAARTMVSARQDEALPPVQRSFVYLPFEHAEDMTAQDEAVRLFAQLGVAAPSLAGYVKYAQQHRAIIERFGRFPHRNAVLGRPSSAEETAFLQLPGSRF